MKTGPADHRDEALQITGIPLLDKITGGGLPRPSAVAFLGPIGSGKSMMIRELVANFLRQGCHVLYYCIDDPAEVVRLGLEDHYHIAVGDIEREGRMEFVDMFSLGAEKLAESLKTDPESVLEETLKFSDLLSLGRNFALKPTEQGKVLVMDSVTPFFLLTDSRRVFQYMQVMRFATRIAKAVTLMSFHTEVVEPNIENATANLVDGVVEMRKRQGEVLLKGGTLKVLRMGRNVTPSRGYFYQITNQGIVFSSTPMM